jgi:hypothetical protein
MSVTFDTFQLASGWLNVLAPANIDAMLDTFDTFHEPIGWFMALAVLNILAVLLTFDMSHEAMLPLPVLPVKALALLNMLAAEAPAVKFG